MSSATLLGIDWGSTHRRAYWLDAQGRLISQQHDDQGLLAAQGRFAALLTSLVDSGPPLDRDAQVLMSGAVGSAQGWVEVPYLDAPRRLADWARNAQRIDAPLPQPVSIVPGCRWRDAHGTPDVMRGEEMQLLGAVQLAAAPGQTRWFCLPGTHGKWVRVEDDRITALHSYLTGELFALLTQHGMLAPLTQDQRFDEQAFHRGVQAAGESVLSNALFRCRAQVVAGDMPAQQARSFLSGVLIGAEWHDMTRRFAVASPQIGLVAAPALAQLHRLAAQAFGAQPQTIDPDHAYLAALRVFAAART
jgi:2-dehydro-3-deoxygalactonokinase